MQKHSQSGLGFIAAILTLLVGSTCVAAPLPYDAVGITYDTSTADDADLKALVEQLHLAVAEKNFKALDAALAKDLAVIECDTDPTKPCDPSVKTTLRSSPNAPASQRLRQALCCRDIAPAKITKALRDETVLGLIGTALEEERIGTHPALPGAACLPAWPIFDAARARSMAVAAEVDPENLRVTTTEMILRERPDAQAPVTARLAIGQMAPLVTELPESLPDGWTAIALPRGGYGYTDQLGLNEIAPGGLCFKKNPAGLWEISLTIQRRS